jgi:hypothetical protein
MDCSRSAFSGTEDRDRTPLLLLPLKKQFFTPNYYFVMTLQGMEMFHVISLTPSYQSSRSLSKSLEITP